jgi:hypothetical protein
MEQLRKIKKTAILKGVVVLLFILFSSKTYSQAEIHKIFYPLSPIDTIKSFEKVKRYHRIDSLNRSDFFFAYLDEKYKSGLVLLKRVQDEILVYKFESDLFTASNTRIDSFRLETSKYISIQVSRFPSGSCSNTYGFLTILDIETCKTIDYCNYSLEECYNEDGVIRSQSHCKTTTNIDGEVLSLINSCNSDALNCTGSGTYKVEDDMLIKTIP